MVGPFLLVTTSLVLIFVCRADAACDDGWSEDGPSCYFVSDDKLNWDNAQAACETLGGDLTSITSAVENDFINKTYLVKYPASGESYDSYWIGLRRYYNPEEELRWQDGAVLNYENWDEGEPNNLGGQEDCIEIMSDRGGRDPAEYPIGVWNDYYCDEPLNYVCKKSAS